METWQVSDQEDIENDESSEDDDETEVRKFFFFQHGETSIKFTFYQNFYKKIFTNLSSSSSS